MARLDLTQSPEMLQRAAEACASQGALFAEDLSTVLETGVAVAARRLFAKKRWQVTGKITCKDEQKATAVLLCLQAGMSKRQIRAGCKVSHYTIDRIEEAAMQGGNLAPLNDRIRAALGRLVLESVEESRDALSSQGRGLEASAWLKSVAMMLGISVDKNQLVTGLPTEISEQRAAPGRAELESWLRDQGLVVAHPAVAVDVHSPDTVEIAEQIEEIEGATTAVATEDGSKDGTNATHETDAPGNETHESPGSLKSHSPTTNLADPSDPTPIGPDDPGAEPGGGGRLRPAAGPTADGSTPTL